MFKQQQIGKLADAAKKEVLRVTFEGRLELEIHGSKFTSDAPFANPKLYEYLEAEAFVYAIRLPGNDALLQDIMPMSPRFVPPAGWPEVHHVPGK